ncbi:MAG: ROK family protein [Eudoraea sp.]|uniref:ROK family protein n=1 Tax=Eudoraea sp. TaxID=1979955 RepID=UPI003263C82D
MDKSKSVKLIGVDLGGTKVNVGLVEGNKILSNESVKLPKDSQSEWNVINIIIDLIKKQLGGHKVEGIGIGVPSIVDREKGIIHEVQNIPLWKEVPLAEILKKEFGIPVFIDNDANCFAYGELKFGLGKGYRHLVGLTLGTGMGSGIITNGHLMGDANCGSGEFGMIPYKDGILEDYCSGKYFKNFYESNGEELMTLAKVGDTKALEAFNNFGEHLGNAVKTILYAVDPQVIIIGGSVVNSVEFFETSLTDSISDFAYKKVLEKFEILYSKTSNIAILGAASLYYDRIGNNNL